MFKINPILKTDSYKCSHFAQFPPGTSNTYYHVGPRIGGAYAEFPFFGMQGFINDNLAGFFCTPQDVEHANSRLKAHGVAFPYEGWMHIATVHSGRLPVKIKAIPEGTVIYPGVVPVTIESTDPKVPWLPGWLETMLLRGTWYPTTVGARSYACKKVIHKYLTMTSDNPLSELAFKLHDFGARGASSGETAAIGGAAHLVNFKGSDTLEGIEWMAHHYGDGADGVPGFSINAMEHGTVLAWTRPGEEQSYKNMLETFLKPGTLVACVSDAYDYFKTLEDIWCGSMHEQVKNSGGIIVVRPDSGIPADVILKSHQIFERKLGCLINSKGYKLLPSYFKLIQGDGNDDEHSIEDILELMERYGYSTSNIAFGMGAGLLQKLDRDTLRFAEKLSELTVRGEVRPVCKTVATDPTKASRAGRFSTLLMGRDNIVTVSGDNHPRDLLQTVFYNGVALPAQQLDDIRAQAGKAFV